MTRGADLVVQTLANAGVDTIFALSGNQIMPIFDACIDAKIRIVHTRHEGAAVFMADAYAQLTGKIGVALVTAAPGFANALGALFSARHSESPVLFLSGDSPLTQDGRGSFQELDQTAMSAPLTKHSVRPAKAEALGAEIANAIRIALAGRPGPVHLALPFDVLNAEVDAAGSPEKNNFEPSVESGPAEFIAQVANALKNAQRPVIVTGPALNRTRAGRLIDQLADAAGSPVIPMESPRGLKDPSLGALASVLAQADVIVSLGKKLDYTMQFAAPPAIAEDGRLYLVDADADVLDASAKNAGDRLAASCAADPQAVVRALIEAPTATDRKSHRDEVSAALAARPATPEASAPIHPAVLCEAVDAVLREANDPVLIVDGGEFGQWAQACLSANARVINGTSGAIGGGLCYALGAKAARPDSDVFILMGDGTAGFHFSEFETAHRYALNFTAIIGNDAKWNAEYQIQLRNYGENRTYECELNPTRYDLGVVGLGGHGEHVTEPGELDAALRRAHASGLPACVNVMIEGLPAPAGPSH